MSERAKLLVVDDSEMTHRLVMTHLGKLPIEIFKSMNGIDAIEKAKQIVPDIVLLDINMEGVDGYEVCVRIKDEPRLADTRVIFLSGQDESVDKVKGFDVGAVDYVTKPFDPAELKMRVGVHLETKRLIDLLAREANLDSLTGLHNKKYFRERMVQELHRLDRTKRMLGLMFIDVDNFKQINDGYGHPVGDQVLQRVAELICMSGRRSDVVCRWGGDEFVVILPELDARHVAIVGERLVKAVEKDVVLDELIEGGITVSVGVAGMTHEDELSVEVAVKRADKAMYASKAKGKNCVSVANGNQAA